MAEAAREWALTAFGDKPVEHRSDYEHNAWPSVVSDVIGRKHAGLAASIMAASLRHIEQLKTNNAGLCLDEWRGQDRERLTFYGDLLSTKGIEGVFGTTILRRIRTREGHTVVWFSSSEELCDDASERLFTATVKRHAEHNAQKQTVVSRPVEARDEARQKLEQKLQKKKPERAARKAARQAA